MKGGPFALALVWLLVSPLDAQSQTYSLRSAAVGAAAESGSGGPYALSAAIGQPVAADQTPPAPFTISAGFWPTAVPPPNINLIRNRSFADDTTHWLRFATPDMSYMVSGVIGGVFEFYRLSPPPGTGNQAVVFQPVQETLTAASAIDAAFEIGNSSTVRKRVSVLLHDGDFSDLAVCTFWLPPGAPLSSYGMRTHTTKAWTNATISFYAATAGSDGGAYRLDNVSVKYAPAVGTDRTECLDPTTPAPPGGADGSDLIGNGDFGTGALAPWATFGQIVHQIAGGVFEFYRPAGPPAGVLLQDTAQPLASGTRLTSTFDLGNSSGVRKRVTVLLHDKDFSDLSACTFWLEAGQPLQPFTMKSFTTRAWTRATWSIYGATVGTESWTRVDNATLRTTPAASLTGTECIEPEAVADASIAADLGLPGGPGVGSRLPARSSSLDESAVVGRSRQIVSSGDAFDWAYVLDLHGARRASVSWRPASGLRGVEVSVDGITWATLHGVIGSDDGTAVVDLGAFAGAQLFLKVLSDRDTASPLRPVIQIEIDR